MFDFLDKTIAWQGKIGEDFSRFSLLPLTFFYKGV